MKMGILNKILEDAEYSEPKLQDAVSRGYWEYFGEEIPKPKGNLYKNPIGNVAYRYKPGFPAQLQKFAKFRGKWVNTGGSHILIRAHKSDFTGSWVKKIAWAE